MGYAEIYETRHDADYTLPVHLDGNFNGIDHTVIDTLDGAGVLFFRSTTGISSYVRAKSIVKESGSYGLFLEVHSDNPRPKNQEDAVTRLLRKLPMFNPVPITSAKAK